LLVEVIGFFGFLILRHFGSKLDAQSKAYIDAVVPKIVSHWEVQALMADASPELLEIAPREEMEPLFKAFSDKLGALKEYRGS
jgi:hypothetical protein